MNAAHNAYDRTDAGALVPRRPWKNAGVKQVRGRWYIVDVDDRDRVIAGPWETRKLAEKNWEVMWAFAGLKSAPRRNAPDRIGVSRCYWPTLKHARKRRNMMVKNWNARVSVLRNGKG